jgi:hypothetical protein
MVLGTWGQVPKVQPLFLKYVRGIIPFEYYFELHLASLQPFHPRTDVVSLFTIPFSHGNVAFSHDTGKAHLPALVVPFCYTSFRVEARGYSRVRYSIYCRRLICARGMKKGRDR